jgi:hypothetical protein
MSNYSEEDIAYMGGNDDYPQDISLMPTREELFEMDEAVDQVELADTIAAERLTAEQLNAIEEAGNKLRAHKPVECEVSTDVPFTDNEPRVLLHEEVWERLRAAVPNMSALVVAGAGMRAILSYDGKSVKFQPFAGGHTNESIARRLGLIGENETVERIIRKKVAK